ncbi:MAG: hypothetical protein LC687_05200 [Actinobacteria bacterium]|nr:hypothetical protein [Actinomycetota bacterium]
MAEISTSAFFKGKTEAERKAYEEDILRSRKEGHQEGYNQARVDILSWLQDEYVNNKKLDRRSPEAKALLDLAGRIAKTFGEASS